MPKRPSLRSEFNNSGWGKAAVALGTVASAAQESVKYGTNYATPNLLPNAGELFELVTRGWLAESNSSSLFRYNGIAINSPSWQMVLDSYRSYPGHDETLEAYYRGMISDEVAERWIKNLGYTGPAAYSWAWNKPFSWSPEEYRIMRAMSLIDSNDYTAYKKSSGIVRPMDDFIFEKLYKTLTWSESIDAYNRGYIGEDKLKEWFHLEGLTDPLVVETARRLADHIPSPSELIGMAVKEIWNGDIVKEFGYDEEFNLILPFQEWMKKAGYAGDPKIKGLGGNQPESWAQAFWREHWRVPSNEQAFAMLHRLRPTGGVGGKPRVEHVPGTSTPVEPFTITQVEQVLKTNDYPPIWRDRLAALSFNVLRLVDIRRVIGKSIADPIFKENAIGPGYTILQWGIENYLDRGQTPEAAKTLAEMSVYDAQQALLLPDKKRNAQIKARQYRSIIAQFNVGTLKRDDAVEELDNIGYQTYQANALLNVIEEEIDLACVKSQIAATKKLFTKGTIAEPAARTKLASFGVTTVRIDKYILCWKGLMNQANAHQQGQQVLSMLRDGFITHMAAIDQLNNLGVETSETLAAIAKAEQLVGLG